VHAVKHAATRVIDGRTFTGDLPATECRACGEVLISGPGMLAFGDAISLELARSGEIGPEGFRWLRKAAHLKATELAALFDVTPMQVSRWETGKKPLERRAVAWVCALVLEKLEGKPAGREVLDLLAANKHPPRRVRLAVKLAG
jgi:hypothetical protein